MSRLIDADVLRNQWLYEGKNEHIYDTNAFLDSIDEQPTAFDKEKVIEELEKTECSRNLEATAYRQKAIEIVKRGGIDDRTDD